MSGNEEARGCFLCAPDPELIFVRDANTFALAGLGPVVPYYSLVASTAHVPSASDGQSEGINLVAAVRRVVAGFNARGMQCVIAEHGRVPVCAERVGQERHCYHAHLLVFPGADLPTLDVSSMFGQVRRYSSIEDGLSNAPAHGEYYLLSDNTGATVVHSQPRYVPRQFLRSLLAAEVGRPELADWRKTPARQSALDYAVQLRRFFEGEE